MSTDSKSDRTFPRTWSMVKNEMALTKLTVKRLRNLLDLSIFLTIAKLRITIEKYGINSTKITFDHKIYNVTYT